MDLNTFSATYTPPVINDGNASIDHMSEEQFNADLDKWLTERKEAASKRASVGDLWDGSIWAEHIANVYGDSILAIIREEFVSPSDLRVATVRECLDLGLSDSVTCAIKTLLNAAYRMTGTVEVNGAIKGGNIERIVDPYALEIEESDIVTRYGRREETPNNES